MKTSREKTANNNEPIALAIFSFALVALSFYVLTFVAFRQEDSVPTRQEVEYELEYKGHGPCGTGLDRLYDETAWCNVSPEGYVLFCTFGYKSCSDELLLESEKPALPNAQGAEPPLCHCNNVAGCIDGYPHIPCK